MIELWGPAFLYPSVFHGMAASRPVLQCDSNETLVNFAGSPLPHAPLLSLLVLNILVPMICCERVLFGEEEGYLMGLKRVNVPFRSLCWTAVYSCIAYDYMILVLLV